ncbi:acyltransferase family protein, partial [Vibrio parahaemolyticus]
IIAKLGIPPDDAKASLRYVVYDTNEELSGEARDALEYFMNNRELAFNFILQLLMLHAWNPLYLTFNPPLWSISTLFFFYLCFPLLAPRLMRLRHKGWWLLAIAALYMLPPLWAIQQDAYGIPVTGMLHRMPLLRLPEFLAGILLCGLFREWRAAGGQLGIAARLALGAFVLASFLATVWLLKGERYWY